MARGGTAGRTGSGQGRRRGRILALALALAAAAGVARADPVVGVWQTQPDEGAFAHVTIASCGPAFCGTITRTFRDGAEFRSDTIGRQIVIDMVPSAPGSYRGRVWRPANDRIYSGGIELQGNTMRLAGCVAGGLICKRQTWQKIN